MFSTVSFIRTHSCHFSFLYLIYCCFVYGQTKEHGISSCTLIPNGFLPNVPAQFQNPKIPLADSNLRLHSNCPMRLKDFEMEQARSAGIHHGWVYIIKYSYKCVYDIHISTYSYKCPRRNSDLHIYVRRKARVPTRENLLPAPVERREVTSIKPLQ